MVATFSSNLIFLYIFIFIIFTMMLFIFQRILMLLASKKLIHDAPREGKQSFQTFIGFKWAGSSKSNFVSVRIRSD